MQTKFEPLIQEILSELQQAIIKGSKWNLIC